MKRYSRLNNSWSAVHLIFIALIVIQSLSVGIIMLRQHGLGEGILLAHARDMMLRLADGAIKHTDTHLKSAENIARITTGHVKSGLLVPEKSEELEFYLLEILKNSTAISGITYGNNQGEFLYVSRQPDGSDATYLTKIITIRNDKKKQNKVYRNPDFSIQSQHLFKDNYDPRTRPWYDAFREQKLLWMPPYIFYTSQNPGITVSIPSLNPSGHVIGAFGVDIEISSLSDFLAHRQVSTNSSSFIVTHNGSIAAHSNIETIKKFNDEGHLQLVNITDLTENAIITTLWDRISSIDQKELLTGASLDFMADGKKYLAFAQTFPEDSEWPWIMTVMAPENDFIGTLRKSKRYHLLKALAYSIAITLFIFLLAARFLKPIRKLLQHAHFDPLTDLYNRRAFFEITSKMLKYAQQQHFPVCIAMMDIDNFKSINDTHGHNVGDEVLVAIAGRLRSALNEKDIIGRYGGEEFVVLLTDATPEQGLKVCERLRRAIADTPIQSAGAELKATVSVGLAPVPNKALNISQTLYLADQALLKAKNAGKNQVVLAG
jgi:diguanylate cyclase (GGDEF)-like protein